MEPTGHASPAFPLLRGHRGSAWKNVLGFKRVTNPETWATVERKAVHRFTNHKENRGSEATEEGIHLACLLPHRLRLMPSSVVSAG